MLPPLRETQSWLLEGSALKAPHFLRGSTAIVWSRDYSTEDEARCDCAKLKQVLQVRAPPLVEFALPPMRAR